MQADCIFIASNVKLQDVLLLRVHLISMIATVAAKWQESG